MNTMSKLFLSTYTLLIREITLFYRQKNRLIGALLQPFIFWLLIGSGLNASFSPSNVNTISYIEFFFPGMILMVILFTSIFSTIGIIEDRREGFLQSVLIAPVPRSGVVLGKMLGGTCLGVMQGFLFMLLALTPLVTIKITIAGFVMVVSVISLLAFGITGLGVIAAWGMDSIQGYHAIMSVVMFPLWIFSGAVFPAEGTPVWLYWIMNLNPLTHGLNLMRQGFYWSPDQLVTNSKHTLISGSYLLTFCILNFVVATWIVGRRR